jgi:hypothetical protein
VRDEGQHALYLVGNYVHPDIKPGFSYRVMRGVNPSDTCELGSLLSSDSQGDVVRLEQIRSSRVQGPLCMVKASRHEGIYTDLQLHPYGIIFLPVGTVRGDSFRMYDRGELVGLLRVSTTDSSQPYCDRVGTFSSLDTSEGTIEFEKTGRVVPGPSVEYTKTRYALRDHVVEGLFDYTPVYKDGVHGPTERIEAVIEVTTSTRDGLPLTLSVLTANSQQKNGKNSLPLTALGVSNRSNFFDFGVDSGGTRRFGFISGPHSSIERI